MLNLLEIKGINCTVAKQPVFIIALPPIVLRDSKEDILLSQCFGVDPAGNVYGDGNSDWEVVA
jgi:hypothetical protein